MVDETSAAELRMHPSRLSLASSAKPISGGRVMLAFGFFVLVANDFLT
jgi:hypothetical protein